VAERKPVEVQPASGGIMPVGVRVFRWEGIVQGDTCAPLNIAGCERLTLHAIGTFDTGTITVQGTVDPDPAGTFTALRDQTGTAISLTAAGIRKIGEDVVQVKPVLTGGGGSTDIDVFLLVGTVARR